MLAAVFWCGPGSDDIQGLLRKLERRATLRMEGALLRLTSNLPNPKLALQSERNRSKASRKVLMQNLHEPSVWRCLGLEF